MKSFGLSCDEDTHRLIQSIPPGIRSKTIRRVILNHAHEIEEMKDEYWVLQLEKKIEENRLQKEHMIQEEKMRKEHEAAMERSLHRKRREMALQQDAHERKTKRVQEKAAWEAERWLNAQSSGQILIEVN